MLIWVEQGTGRWSRRVKSGLGTIIDTSPSMLSRSVADMTDARTQDMALLWLALSLGHPLYVPDTLQLQPDKTQWCIMSEDSMDYWKCPIPIAVDRDAGLGRAIAAAWTWWSRAASPAAGEAGSMMSNPWPPNMHLPVSPEEHLAQHTMLRQHTETARTQRQRASLIERWAAAQKP
jgi:hypothetical protein